MLLPGFASATPGDVGLGTKIAPYTVERDHVERSVGFTVGFTLAVGIEAVSYHLARGGFYGSRTA